MSDTPIHEYTPTPTSAGATAPSLGELLGEVSKDLSLLVRQEIALAKAEATQTGKRLGTGVGMFAGAALAGFFVLMFLSVALWWAVGDETGRGWSALIVVGVWAVIAAILVVVGRSQLAAAKGLPQTTDTLARVPDALTPTAPATTTTGPTTTFGGTR